MLQRESDGSFHHGPFWDRYVEQPREGLLEVDDFVLVGGCYNNDDNIFGRSLSRLPFLNILSNFDGRQFFCNLPRACYIKFMQAF